MSMKKQNVLNLIRYHSEGNDIGFAVIDSKGRVYEKYSLTIADIYCGERELMKSAYYADKLPQYEEEMANSR